MLEETTAYDFYNDYDTNGSDGLGCSTIIMPNDIFTC